MNTESTSQDGRIVAEQNEVEVLCGLHRFGWLRTADIASLVWPEAKQAIQMARRTLRRLSEQNAVLSERLPDGVPAYALSLRGAMRIRMQYPTSQSGKDLMRHLHQYQHRNLCNEYAIYCLNQGRPVYTERELLANRAPFKIVDGKQPDMLVALDQDWQECTWCEVETCWKKAADFDKLMRFIVHNTGNSERTTLNPDQEIYLYKIAIVADAWSHIKRIISTLDQLQSDDPHHERPWDIIRDSIWLAVKRAPDDWWEGTLYELLQQMRYAGISAA